VITTGTAQDTPKKRASAISESRARFEKIARLTTEFLAGRLDAFVPLAGVIQEAEAKEPVTFISLSSEQIEAIRKAMPELR